MTHGICHLSVVPVRAAAAHSSEQCDQLLFGEHFPILETRKAWSRVQLHGGKDEGWIANDQFRPLPAPDLEQVQEQAARATELVAFCSRNDRELVPLLLGAQVGACPVLDFQFEGEAQRGKGNRDSLLQTALLYLNAPYLAGGRSPFGIDAGALAQLVYLVNGHRIARHPSAQARQGEVLSFIEESQPGDLAFFDDEHGEINHVGIIMGDNYVIHAHGKVRIDRIDHTGIFNTETGRYSHSLRVIKNLLDETA